MFEPTLKSAIEYGKLNNIEEWVHEYLCGEGNNKGFSDGLKLEPRQYTEPQLMNLDLFKRCYGPEPDMLYHIREDETDHLRWFWGKIERIAERYKTGTWDMPPLIISHFDGEYMLNDGNHRFEALKRLGVNEYWVILWK